MRQLIESIFSLTKKLNDKIEKQLEEEIEEDYDDNFSEKDEAKINEQVKNIVSGEPNDAKDNFEDVDISIENEYDEDDEPINEFDKINTIEFVKNILNDVGQNREMNNIIPYYSKYRSIDVLNVGILLNNVDMVKMILDCKNVNVNEISTSGLTPLTMACLMSNENFVNLLIHYGALVNVKDDYGTVPFFYADEFNNVNIKRLLYENCVNPYLLSNPVSEFLHDLFKKDKNEIKYFLLGDSKQHLIKSFQFRTSGENLNMSGLKSKYESIRPIYDSTFGEFTLNQNFSYYKGNLF